MKMRHFQALLLGTLILLVAGCGYKPSSHYARAVVGETVSTEVVISMEDPENTVIIKDALDSAVIRHFRVSLRDKGAADTHLKIMLESVTFTPLQYDRNGYIVAYRTSIRLRITRYHGDLSKNYDVSGIHDFAIEAQAIISDQARFDAIESGAQKALESFIAMVSAEGTRINP